MTLNWVNQLKSDVSGSTAIQYAIALPVLLMLVLGVMDTARLLWTYATLQRAAEAAARCGAINATVAAKGGTPVACSTATAIQSKAVSEAWGLTVSASAFAVTDAACGKQVSVTYTFNFVIPWMLSPTTTLRPTACHPV